MVDPQSQPRVTSPEAPIPAGYGRIAFDAGPSPEVGLSRIGRHLLPPVWVELWLGGSCVPVHFEKTMVDAPAGRHTLAARVIYAPYMGSVSYKAPASHTVDIVAGTVTPVYYRSPAPWYPIRDTPGVMGATPLREPGQNVSIAVALIPRGMVLLVMLVVALGAFLAALIG